MKHPPRNNHIFRVGAMLAALVLFAVIFISNIWADCLRSSPLVDLKSAYWTGEGDMYLLHHRGGGMQPIEIYCLREGSTKLKWVNSWDNTSQVPSDFDNATELVPLGPKEFIYWRPQGGIWLDPLSEGTSILKGSTNRMLFDASTRSYLRNTADNLDVDYSFRLKRVDLDTGEEVVITERLDDATAVSSATTFPIDHTNTQYITNGFDPGLSPKTFLADTSTSPATLSVLHNVTQGSFWLRHEDEIFISAGALAINWFNILTLEFVRQVGPQGIDFTIAHTDVTHFFGKAEFVTEGEDCWTEFPVVSWSDDYTTKTIHRFRIDHPETPPSPQDYIDHLLGVGRVNSILFFQPDRNDDNVIDVADLVTRINEIEAETASSEARTE